MSMQKHMQRGSYGSSVIMGVVGGVLILLISPVMAETMTLSETAKGYMRFMGSL